MPSRSARLVLANLTIAAPCSASWDAMTGDQRVRFCGACEKHVYDLSGMTTAEAEDLLAERGENLCVRYYERADGTVMTSDCPVGVSKRRRRKVAAAAMAVAASAAGAAGATWAALTGDSSMPAVETACPAEPAPEAVAPPPPVVIETEQPAPVKPVEPRPRMGKPTIRR